MKLILITLFATLCTLVTMAQQKTSISGTVKTSGGILLSKASVSFYQTGTTDTLRGVTDDMGQFKVNVGPSGNYVVLISYLGFENEKRTISIEAGRSVLALEDFIMKPMAGLLEAVTIESQKVQIKEDTVSYLVDSTMYRKNDNVESMLKNLPGVQVDKDGNVTAQGKQVTKVKVNGKDFFNGDVTTATRELTADMVDRVQFIDDYGDQAAFTGIKDGDPTKTMNIQLKKDKNKGYFGNSTVGAGTDTRYIGSVTLHRFNNNQQFSVLGNMNNTNGNLFNFGGGGGGGGMGNTMRSMGMGKGGAGAGAAIGNTGNSDGISTIKSIGLNYRDNWSEALSVYGSYSFSGKSTTTLRTSNQQILNPSGKVEYLQDEDNFTESSNHRFSFNMEYKPDTMNYVKFSPNITYNKTQTQYRNDYISQTDGRLNLNGNLDNLVRSNVPNYSGSLLYNHRFKKRGRTLSFNFSGSTSQTQSDEDDQTINQFITPIGGTFTTKLLQNITQDNQSYSYGSKVSYSEPLSKKRNIEFNYSYNYQLIGNDRENFNVDPNTGNKTFVDSSSNIYDNTYITQRIGVNIKTTEKKYNYAVGFSAQPAVITTKSVTGDTTYTNHLMNYFPVIRFAYNFSRSRSLNINYNGNSSQPTNAQLQPVVDKSNPQFITIGNPDLKPEFTNTISSRYNNFNFVTGDVFFSNISFSYTQDKIVNSIRILRGGVQETRYRNADGYFTALAFYNVSKPIMNRKFVFNFGGNAGFNNNISYLRDSADAETKNIGKNWIVGQRFSSDIKIKKWLETTVAVNYALNSNKNSAQSQLNSNSIAWTLSSNSRFFLPNNFIISYDAEKTLNYGLSATATANPLIINMALEKQFFEKKNVSLKLQAYDLLNQNVGISRTVSATGFTDSRTNRLGRYFLLSVICRLNKFFGDMQQGKGPMGMPEGGGEFRMKIPGM